MDAGFLTRWVICLTVEFCKVTRCNCKPHCVTKGSQHSMCGHSGSVGVRKGQLLCGVLLEQPVDLGAEATRAERKPTDWRIRLELS